MKTSSIKAILVVCVGLLIGSTSFAQKTKMVGSAAMYPTKNIIQNAVNSKDHTTLVAAVKAAGLVGTLEGKGPFTVFAPTNEAFDKLPAGTVSNLVKPENKALLTKILTYHVVPGKISSKDLMKWIKNQIQIADANIELEKAKLLPDLFAGYNNMSIKGIGADDKFYGSSKRFSSIQLGVGIPVFAGAQKAKIASAKINRQVMEANYQAEWRTFKTRYIEIFIQYSNHLQNVNYFETTALKNADIITRTAQKQLDNGSINYLEWVQLVNQAIDVRNDYIEAVRLLNHFINQLNYFTGK